ncbi:unnamed protein product, partial [Anisakis simplex]|uniref:Uncharacterized protein n=1 Tax=Anisakis simplex TaxID=6269 RepID=A0A0M3JPP8_ANISI
MTQTDSVDDIDSRSYPSAQIVVCNSRFLTHPDYPLGEHSCEFEINEMSLAESVLKQRPYVVRERYHERNDAYQSAQAVSLSLPSSPSKMLVISPSSEHHQSPSTSQRTTANALLLSNMD